ncbi:MAG: hypothetical protein K8R88_01355 [Armatimonadetes bacterium]|nr:hypothetical protein [Armatimonadota bacterium]
MPDQVVSPVNGSQYYGAVAAKPKSALNMETFMRLLTTQLSHQNPLEPMKDTDFFAQVAQLGQVQGLDKLDKGNQVTQAQGMIGKTVTALRPNSPGGVVNDTLVSGVVTGMIVRNGANYLQVTEANGGVAEVTADAIQSIQATPTSNGISKILDAASAANLIGKKVTAPHPTLKDAAGNPEVMESIVQTVSFEKGVVYLSAKDRLGNVVKLPLNSVTAFGTP